MRAEGWEERPSAFPRDIRVYSEAALAPAEAHRLRFHRPTAAPRDHVTRALALGQQSGLEVRLMPPHGSRPALVFAVEIVLPTRKWDRQVCCSCGKLWHRLGSHRSPPPTPNLNPSTPLRRWPPCSATWRAPEAARPQHAFLPIRFGDSRHTAPQRRRGLQAASPARRPPLPTRP
jgi:hypothetical protein